MIRYVDYAPRGAARELFRRRDPELLLAGPAGTGKTRSCLEKVHACCEKYPRLRSLLVRKTRTSLTNTALVTFEQKVLPSPASAPFNTTDQEYRYPNGSIVGVAGLDKPSKIMSSEYDLIFVPEATELDLNDWEMISTRLRNGRMPYQQLIADCNPWTPTHWLKKRAEAGQTVMLESRHEDNPSLWDGSTGSWTDFGKVYISKLDALSGVRFLRLRKGIWAAADGLVYESWDRAVHLVDRFEIPPAWPRYWVIDFGFTNPFVWQAWAEDPDGRLFRYREIYQTQRIAEDHAKDIKRLTENEPRPRAIICDHDAEDRATLERHLGMRTTAATKTVSPGIQAVESRLRKAGDDRPRLFLIRDSTVTRDAGLVEAGKPAATEEEMDGYIWDTSSGRKKGEEPVKKDDHGADATRYLVAFVDKVGRTEVRVW